MQISTATSPTSKVQAQSHFALQGSISLNSENVLIVSPLDLTHLAFGISLVKQQYRQIIAIADDFKPQTVLNKQYLSTLNSDLDQLDRDFRVAVSILPVAQNKPNVNLVYYTYLNNHFRTYHKLASTIPTDQSDFGKLRKKVYKQPHELASLDPANPFNVTNDDSSGNGGNGGSNQDNSDDSGSQNSGDQEDQESEGTTTPPAGSSNEPNPNNDSDNDEDDDGSDTEGGGSGIMKENFTTVEPPTPRRRGIDIRPVIGKRRKRNAVRPPLSLLENILSRHRRSPQWDVVTIRSKTLQSNLNFQTNFTFRLVLPCLELR